MTFTEITYGAFIFGVVVFLLQWTARHILDRLFLPRVFDWWARRSKARALKRAKRIKERFEADLQDTSNIYLSILRFEAMRFAWNLLFSGIFFTLFLWIIWRQYEPIGTTRVADLIFITFIVLIVYISLSIVSAYVIRRTYMIVRDPVRYRFETVIRIESLLEVAQLESSEIKTWLETISAISPPQTPP